MSRLRAAIKQSLPPPARRVARFLYRLPVHLRTDLSYQHCAERGFGHGTIFIEDDIVIRLPDHAIANSVFRSMAFESSNQDELKSFLRLAEGKSRHWKYENC